MRRVLVGDVAAMAAVLLARPEAAWPGLVADALTRAEAADAHRRATGRAHPLYGTGSLMAAVSGMDAAAADDFEADATCRAWATVFEALVWHRAGIRHGRGVSYPAAQEMQSGIVGSSSRRLGAISSPHSRQSP